MRDSNQLKKNSKPNIAPLQLPTLATFRSWGSSAGAGRARFAGPKICKVSLWNKCPQAGIFVRLDAATQRQYPQNIPE